MIEVGLEIAAKTAVSELAKRLVKGVKRVLDESADPILAGIDRVESQVDRQLLTSLGAGLTFLRLGDYSQAITELVRAEAADKAAAVSSFWLGMALMLAGREEDAMRFIQHSLRLNPFLIEGAICRLSDQNAQHKAMSPRPFTTMEWERNVSDFRRSPQLLPRWRPRWTVTAGSSAVEVVSMSGDAPVLQCLLGSKYVPLQDGEIQKASSALVALSRSGDLLWARKCDEKLLFASPSLVVLQSIPPRRYTLLNIETGTLVRDLTDEYFATAFCPKLSVVQQSKSFKDQTHNFMTPKEALVATKGPKASWFDFYGHSAESLSEEMTVHSLADKSSLIALNRWQHQHNPDPQGGRGWCSLDSKATVAYCPGSAAFEPGPHNG